MTVFVANTNILELLGLQSAVDNSYINDATVTVTVKDTSGVVVSGPTWPLTMDYVASSNGNYRATLPATAGLVDDTEYIAYIDADGGASQVGHWEYHFKARTRTY